jgi:putative radical SAM enzyme (TIGR03279 family)
LLEIVHVFPGSLAAKLGLAAGDVAVSINGQEVNDVIDFQFFSAEERIVLKVLKSGRTLKTVKIGKEPDDTLGLVFSPLKIKRCRNNCIFCFVDQMPPGCRKTLYVKDDDFRASFLYGNFITLSALSESDWERIFTQRLSPLYISVHAADPALRSSVLRNKKAPDIMESLKRLADGGIRMHTQIVLCPGINDGERLVHTVDELSRLYPFVASIAVVPVGLTAFRKNLYPLRSFTRQESRKVIEVLRAFAAKFKKQFGTGLVFASDEFYIKAKEAFPPASFYEDFPQIENGVGMVAAFLHEVSKTRLPARGPQSVAATVVTGVSFGEVLAGVLTRLKEMSGLTLRQITVKNRFLGTSVTVTGLLSGGDLLHALKGKRLGDLVLIPSNMLKEDEDVFLDGMRLDQLQQALNVPVCKVDGFRDMVRLFRKGA